MNTMKAFLLAVLVTGFTSFTAFSQTNDCMTNLVRYVVNSVEVQEVCMACLLEPLCTEYYLPGGSANPKPASLGDCMTSNLTETIAIPCWVLGGSSSNGNTKGDAFILKDTSGLFSNGLPAFSRWDTGIVVATTSAQNISNIDTLGCFTINEQRGTNNTKLVGGKVSIDNFLGQTNLPDYQLRERTLVEDRFVKSVKQAPLGSGGKGTDLVSDDGNGTTNIQHTKDYASNVFYHVYSVTNLNGSVNTNGITGLMQDAQNRFWTNSQFAQPTDMDGSGSGYSTLVQQYGSGQSGTNPLTYGGLSGYGDDMNGGADKFFWVDDETPGIYRDANLVMFFGIPKIQGTGWVKRIWIDADFSRWPFFRVIAIFIYIGIVWSLFAFGLKKKYESWKAWYSIHLLTSIASGVSATAANVLLASLNPVAVVAGGAYKLYLKIIGLIALASIGSFFIGLFFTFWRISQINPTSTGLMNMPIFMPAHSMASNLTNSKSMLHSAWDLLTFVVPISMFFAIWVENWLFEGAVLVSQFVKRIFA